jgi:hypothetical protein
MSKPKVFFRFLLAAISFTSILAIAEESTKAYVEVLESQRQKLMATADELQKYMDLNKTQLSFTARELLSHWINSRVGRNWPAKRPLPARMSELLEENSVNWPDHVGAHFRIVQEAFGIFRQMDGNIVHGEQALFESQHRFESPAFQDGNDQEKNAMLLAWNRQMGGAKRFEGKCALEVGVKPSHHMKINEDTWPIFIRVPYFKPTGEDALPFYSCLTDEQAEYRGANPGEYIKWDASTYVFSGYDRFKIDFTRPFE